MPKAGIAQLISQVKKTSPTSARCVRVEIDGKRFIGTGVFLIREDLAPESYLKNVKDLGDEKEMSPGLIRAYASQEHYKDAKESADIVTLEVAVFDTKYVSNTGQVAINAIFYEYFRKTLKPWFYFRSSAEPVGMFQGDDFVGLVLPFKL